MKKLRKKISNKKPEIIIVKEKHFKLRARILHILLIAFLSIGVSLIPHLSTVNNDNQVVGSDTKYYMRALQPMATSSNNGELLYHAFITGSGGDRPFSLLFFFWLSSMFYEGNFYHMLEDLPLLLSPLLVIFTYIITFAITRNHISSLMASLIAIPSHILIGIYAGFYANWFSLIFGYMVILFLFKLTKEPKKIHFFFFSLLLTVLIFCHTPTWTVYMYVIALFLVVLFLKNRKKNKKMIQYAFLCLLPSVFTDIARLLFIDNSGIQQEISFAMTREVGIHGIDTIWHNLIETAYLTLAGEIANPIILMLIIYWIYTTKVKENYTIFFAIFFSLYTLPLLFADGQIQARFLYEIPFQIPAAVALTRLKDREGSFMCIMICLWLIAVSIYMVSNFYLVVPERFLM
jgi:hypothetical protein